MIALLRLAVLFVLFFVCFIAGSLAVANALPTTASEPGPVTQVTGLLIIVLVNVLVITAIIAGSRWSGWTLAIGVALAYYGAVTVLPQIETWYFLSSLTVDRKVLPRLFLMGVPPAFVFVPLAVRILGKWHADWHAPRSRALAVPVTEWIWKLAVLASAYVVLYWSAGYFIAWQNPELRAFYGQPGDPLPFLTHTRNVLRSDPGIFLFQFLRGALWVLCAVPVIRGSRLATWPTALLVAALFSLPQNIGQILANPLMPIASVRLSHMIETMSSMFLFGLLVGWLWQWQREVTSAGTIRTRR